VEEIEEILEIRTPHYQTAADVTIPSDNENPESIAKQILGNIELLT
jgi:shikimate kinase